METERNFANIARRVIDPEDGGQNLQQFMSNSPWSGQPVLQQVAEGDCRHAWIEHRRGADPESADEKAGDNSTGAGRQHNGRLGKVEMSKSAPFWPLSRGPSGPMKLRIDFCINLWYSNSVNRSVAPSQPLSQRS
jgi:hypothetical protein